ncbi:BLUF domain-containing protein [Sandarakinorhabdus sp.]|uniref:BLUF domain-containing protein n=1 Tax=Sandarakinorhabdus sp. TaxID=1916663 RepID=UPI00333F410E
MPNQLWRLTYTSRRTCRPAVADAEIANIQSVASQYNRRAGLVGALVASNTRFAQVLEGPRDALERIFERICCDTRHDDVLVIGYGPAETKAFTDFQLVALDYDAEEIGESQTAGEAMLAHLQASMNRLEPSSAPVMR